VTIRSWLMYFGALRFSRSVALSVGNAGPGCYGGTHSVPRFTRVVSSRQAATFAEPNDLRAICRAMAFERYRMPGASGDRCVAVIAVINTGGLLCIPVRTVSRKPGAAALGRLPPLAALPPLRVCRTVAPGQIADAPLPLVKGSFMALSGRRNNRRNCVRERTRRRWGDRLSPDTCWVVRCDVCFSCCS
jgi:hypothetical protein